MYLPLLALLIPFSFLRHNSRRKSVSNRDRGQVMKTRLPKLLLPALVFATFVFAYGQPPAGSPADLQNALMNLADQPATRTSFSFDRSELQAAQSLLESGGMDANRAPVALTGISVDNYRYPRPAFYIPETM